MFKKTDRQMPLFSSATQLPEAARRRLEGSWAGLFRRKVYPVLLNCEELFADLYSGGTGRPAWSIARRLGICVLQEMMDLPDQAAVDALSFDIRWQYALDVAPETASLSRRRLIDFRSRLVQVDPDGTRMRTVFDRITSAAIVDLGVSTGMQRLDSTQIRSNIRSRGRIDLFRKTLFHFVNWLSRTAPPKVELLDVALVQWFERAPSGDGFGRVKPGQFIPELQEVAEWLVEVFETFADDAKVTSEEPYQLVARLIAENFDKADDNDSDAKADDIKADSTGGDSPHYVLLRKPRLDGAALQSPFDPDATYGHKGQGYLVQVTETCNNEGPAELLTDYALQGANELDLGKTGAVVGRLMVLGREPDVLLADAGYASGAAVVEAAERGVDLMAPMPLKRRRKDAILRNEFTFNDRAEVTQCPAGQSPKHHGHKRSRRGKASTRHAFFAASACRPCPLYKRCPTQVESNSNAYLGIGDAAMARDEAIAAQRDEEWWEIYSLRAGVESAISELKRAHGLGQLRVRRRARVLFAVAAKLTACNVKRWSRSAAAALAALVAVILRRLQRLRPLEWAQLDQAKLALQRSPRLASAMAT